MSSATANVASRPRTLALTGFSLTGAWPVAAPSAFLVAGAFIGYLFSLDQTVALERLVGVVGAAIAAGVALMTLRRIDRPDGVLVGMALAAFVGGVWVIAASGPDVFRGTVGVLLDALFRPVFGLVKLTNPIAETNTWFIVGYNGLIDLSLVMIFACGALAFEYRRSWMSLPLGGLVLVGLALLVGAGARGGLTGLAAGICMIGVYVWPRRYALLAVIAVPAALALAAVSVLDKGLEFSSTAGRLTYWGDLARLLVEYPLTGVGLGIDTANAIALEYEINPDPERVFYAHNTFVQSYLEQGPLGVLGMLLLPALVIVAALLARRQGVSGGRRPLLVASLGIAGGMGAHGLTDQVVTTNVGTFLLLLGAAAAFATLSEQSLASLSRLTRRLSLVFVALILVGLAAGLALPAGRAQLLLDVGGLKMNRALALPTQSADRAAGLADAEGVLSAALSQDSSHPGVLRDLAWVRSARFDDSGALSAVNAAANSPRIDAFDMLQIAHAYREVGATEQAYSWASRAYSVTGRSVEDAVMGTYAQATLSDARARTLADQAEAAMRARHFGDAHLLFEQALTFESTSQYLQDRIGASQRAIDKYGP